MKNMTTLLTALALTLSLTGAKAITFTTSMHIGAGNTTWDGDDIVVQGCTLTVDGPHSFKSLTLNGAVLNHSPAPYGETENRLQITVAGDAVVDASSRIEVSGRGYLAANTPGAAPPTADDGGGGGHGGDGGNAYFGAAEPGGVGGFGSVTEPTSFGGSAAGTADQGYVRCPGGGAVQLMVGGTLTLSGQVLANGSSASRNDQGGGAGGSVWITAATLTGSGPIVANGGNGESTHGGGGGGGRIALYSGTNTFSGSLTARGGSGTQWGGAGTVFQKATGESAGALTIDNGGAWGALTSLTLPNTASLTVSNMAQVFPTTPLVLTALHIGANAVLFHYPAQALSLTIAGHAQIDLGGSVSGNGCGYPFGDDRGPSPGSVGGYHAGGGAHGGNGGVGYDGEAGGLGGYDLLHQPADYGSAGGTSTSGGPGGAGGGAIRMTVGGTLTLDGTLSANGNGVSYNNAGGGAGGSLWLTVGELAGSGTLSANGGNGEANAHGGGGGGGRIAIYAGSNNYTGSLTARGGLGRQAGGAGTILLKATGESAGALTIDNGGTWGAYTPLSLPVVASLSVSNMAQVFPVEPLALTALRVGANGVLFHYPAQALKLTIAGHAQIDLGGSVNGNGCGYPFGGDRGPSPGSVGGYHAGGGAHGGNGGVGYDGEAGGLGGYGSPLQPADYGSAGGTSTSGGPGGAGGGAIRLAVGGTLTVNGTLSVVGNGVSYNNAGGGAGGSLWLAVGEFAGSGTLSANGGNGEASAHGGGGSGGRIAVYYGQDNFTGGITAGGGLGRQAGGAGTIYRKSSAQTYGLLSCDNQGRAGAFTPLLMPQVCGLAIAGNAVVYPQLGQALTCSSLDLGSGGQLTHLNGQQLRVNVLQDAVVQATGQLTASALGYPIGSMAGPGAGSFGGDSGSGGGYGGSGGHGYEGQAGGSPNGNAAAPLDWGSAGGAGESGRRTAGGGVIHLNVAGTLTVDGSINANGQGSFDNDQGGGSGGSVWLNIGALAGTGSITANGGSGQGSDAGGGGGGRVAIYHNGTGLGLVSVTASGGSGHAVGGTGTVFLGNPLTSEPPVVLALVPAGTLARWVEAVEVTFNVAMDGTTFTPADLVFTTPSGVLPSTQITVTELTPQAFRISFPAQLADGLYTVQVGPAITNSFGTPMTGTHPGTFTINFPRTLTCTQGVGGLTLSWPSSAGLFYRVQSSSDLMTWADVSGWVAGTGTPLQMTAPSTTAPQLFYRVAIGN
ncbi:MAG: hypothetical protein NTW21_12685 [Verrucomicrobia bacterium]|nr:hypothetical protein [Verrucomicrobiota bacterium]